jgi:NAD(P)-dependent dehydrogenase (short-subunit alcohol dehydrogenase family)
VARWTFDDIPDPSGRVAVVTGANTGIGLETARMLAQKGARVVLACRTREKGEAAALRIAAERPRGSATFAPLDLSDLDSVAAFANTFTAAERRLDLLVNNAGVMVPPLGRTKQGFELQFGTNHLGHFALTGLLLDRMLAVPGSRVVTVSSNGHKLGRMDFGNLQWEHGYSRVGSYGRSKLANLLFTYELQRKLAAAGAATEALAAHPGSSRTELTRNLPAWMRLGAVFWPMQGSVMGAVPMLRAATDPDARGGEYYGPAGFGENAGPAKRVRSSARSYDEEVARRLWEESERLTGVSYPF